MSTTDNADPKQLIAALGLKSGPSGPESQTNISVGTVTVFIGPNHSGKSQLLREIQSSFGSQDTTILSKVLGAITFQPFDSEALASIESEFKERLTRYDKDGISHFLLEADSAKMRIPESDLPRFFERLKTVEGLRQTCQPFGRNMVNRMCWFLDGNQRLNLLNTSTREDMRTRMKSTLGILFQADQKRNDLQRITKAAFGWHLVIDVTGKDFRAAISDENPPPNVERNLSDEALSFFSSCTDFAWMSDGVKAFCGMVAAVIASRSKAVLIDEPEAFLHPSLCVTLANELCRQAGEAGRQLIVATHSAPFLLGCVQAGVELNVVRLTYRNRVATSRVMEHGELRSLMRNPLLRSIGALNGVFYESVIVTESETDRAFYEEINNRCLAFEHDGGIHDCLFLNARNWQTTKIIGPLRKLGIPAAAIIDADVIGEESGTSFQALLEAACIPEATRTAIGQLRGQLRHMAKTTSRSVKALGSKAYDGESKESFDDFVEQLAKYGIFVVPCGELENWLPDLARTNNYKSDWLENTFTAMGEDASSSNYLRPSDDDVWMFMAKISEWLDNPDRRGIPDN